MPRILPAGDGALVVEFGDGIDPALNDRVLSLYRLLEADPPPGVEELVPTYRSLLILYDPLVTTPAALSVAVRGLAGAPATGVAPRRTEVPVRYGGQDGPDLVTVAAELGLTPEEVVARHTRPEYRVYMLGFAPGFPYLGGLDPSLAAPRLPEPRTRVPAGSVAIAGNQTGIYPLESPGGWRIIGRTPLRLFDPAAPEPFLLRAGDRVRFVALGVGRDA